jgi:lysophospholipase L1-like esterase
MVVKHYHFHQQIVTGGGVFPPNILGGQDMSVPPPVTVFSEPSVVQSHPKVQTPKTDHTTSNKPGPHQKTVVRVRSDKPILTLWGSSHLAENHQLGPDLKLKLKAQFQRVINPSEGGAKLTHIITEQIEIAMRSHPGPNQVYVIMFGGNNMRKTTEPALEIAKLFSRFRRIMTEAQKANVRVLLCGDIPDPRPAVDSRLKLLDEALKDLEMGAGNIFLSLRGSLLDAQGEVRKDIFKPRGDIHLNTAGTQIVSLRIRQVLEIMLPGSAPVQAPAPVQTPPAPVQTLPAIVQAPAVAKRQRTRVQAPVPDTAPVVVNTPPVVGATLVAAVVNAPAVVDQARVETPMEVEDEDAVLQRLFFKKYGRALPEPEKEKEKENEVDNIKFVIDLTDDADEMEVAAPVVVVKTEPIEIVNVANVNNIGNVNTVYNESGIRVSRRLELIELAKARKAITEFGKSLRKKDIIPEKEAPLAASSNVIATDDTDMAEDVSVNEANSDNPVGSVNSVNTESLTTAEAFEMAEAAIAESDAAIAANQKVIDQFYEAKRLV